MTARLILPLAAALIAGRPALADHHAVLIGVDRYESKLLAPLKFPAEDVAKLADALSEQGVPRERLTVLSDAKGQPAAARPTAANVRRALAAVAKEARPGDTVLVAFSGHGVQFGRDDDGYLCPADAELTDRDSLVSVRAVAKLLKDCPAKVSALFLDACRNDPTDSGMKAARLDRHDFRGLHVPPPKAREAVFVFQSCGFGQRSFEDAAVGHGVFFHYLIRGLRGDAQTPDGDVTVASLADYVTRRVEKHTRDGRGMDPQTPELHGDPLGAPPLFADVGAVRDWRLAVARAKSHRYAEALAAVDRVLKARPRSADALALRAVALLNVSRTEDALAAAAEALRLEPSHIPALLARADIHATNLAPEDGMRDVERVLRLDPANARALAYNGLFLTVQEKLAEADAAFNAAVRANDRDGEVFNTRGCARHLRGDLAGAVSDFTRAIELDERAPSFHGNRSGVLTALGQLAEAVKDADRAVELNPNCFGCRYHQANALLANERYDDAIKAAQRGMTLRPNEGHFDAVIGAALLAQDKPRDALSWLDRAVRADPKNGEYLFVRAGVHLKLEDRTAAERDLKAALTGKLDAKVREAANRWLAELRDRSDANRPVPRGTPTRATGTPSGAARSANPSPAGPNEPPAWAAATAVQMGPNGMTVQSAGGRVQMGPNGMTIQSANGWIQMGPNGIQMSNGHGAADQRKRVASR